MKPNQTYKKWQKWTNGEGKSCFKYLIRLWVQEKNNTFIIEEGKRVRRKIYILYVFHETNLLNGKTALKVVVKMERVEYLFWNMKDNGVEFIIDL